jgi:GTP diphosphokinase / guanosine-3',5'-bis(diphosphate) 3'-diphosphatase
LASNAITQSARHQWDVGTFPNQTAMIDLCIDITGKQQLDQVTAQMSKMADVLSIRCHQRHR